MPPIEVPELSGNNPQLQRALVRVAQAEAKGLEKFDKRLANVDNRINLIGEFKGLFNEVRDSLVPFRTPSDFRDLKGESSLPDILNVASIDKTIAQPGTYDIEVVQLAATDSVMTDGFKDRDNTQLGVGYVRFKTAEGDSRDVYINSSNNTLDGVASAINSASLGVRAQVVHDGTDSDSPFRLIVSSEGTGWKNDLEWPQFYMVDADQRLSLYRERDAVSAHIKLNGMPLMLDENTMKDVLPGVNLDLIRAEPGTKVKIDIRPDIEKIGERAQEFVDKVNAVLQFIQSQNAVGEGGRDSRTQALGGDVSIQAIESRLRTVIQDTQSSMSVTEVQALRDLGIVFNRNGTLDFEADKFQTQLENNFDEVATFFIGTNPLNGFVAKLGALVEGVVRVGDGLATSRESSLRDQKRRIENDQERAATRAQGRVDRARTQFSKVEAAMAQMQNFQMSGGASSLIG